MKKTTKNPGEKMVKKIRLLNHAKDGLIYYFGKQASVC